jgi:hypothetical protein
MLFKLWCWRVAFSYGSWFVLLLVALLICPSTCGTVDMSFLWITSTSSLHRLLPIDLVILGGMDKEHLLFLGCSWYMVSGWAVHMVSGDSGCAYSFWMSCWCVWAQGAVGTTLIDARKHLPTDVVMLLIPLFYCFGCDNTPIACGDSASWETSITGQVHMLLDTFPLCKLYL